MLKHFIFSHPHCEDCTAVAFSLSSFELSWPFLLSMFSVFYYSCNWRTAFIILTSIRSWLIIYKEESQERKSRKQFLVQSDAQAQVFRARIEEEQSKTSVFMYCFMLSDLGISAAIVLPMALLLLRESTNVSEHQLNTSTQPNPVLPEWRIYLPTSCLRSLFMNPLLQMYSFFRFPSSFI